MSAPEVQKAVAFSHLLQALHLFLKAAAAFSQESPVTHRELLLWATKWEYVKSGVNYKVRGGMPTHKPPIFQKTLYRVMIPFISSTEFTFRGRKILLFGSHSTPN